MYKNKVSYYKEHLDRIVQKVLSMLYIFFF